MESAQRKNHNIKIIKRSADPGYGYGHGFGYGHGYGLYGHGYGGYGLGAHHYWKRTTDNMPHPYVDKREADPGYGHRYSYGLLLPSIRMLRHLSFKCLTMVS